MSILIDKLNELSQSDMYPFHMPGHKRRLSTSERLKKIYGIDITEIDGFDNLAEAEGLLKDMKERAAASFGADRAQLLINGSTVGILAAITATVHEKDRIIIARNCHKSVYNAAMLSGAQIDFIYPKQESFCNINAGIDIGQIEGAIGRAVNRDNPGNRRVLLVITSPSYEGIVSDIGRISELCHKNQVLLLVDAAHGAHFGFSDDFPESAIRLGADIVVTSLHKTLPAPTSTALLLINDSCREAGRIEKMLKVYQTSSPSYILMSGIDDCLGIVEDDKLRRELFDKYSHRLDDFYARSGEYKNISLMRESDLKCQGSFAHDKGKLVICDKYKRLSGRDIYDYLRLEHQLQPEMALDCYCLCMTSIADDDEAFMRLGHALDQLDSEIEKIIRTADKTKNNNISVADCNFDRKNQYFIDASIIKEAMWKETRFVPLRESIGLVSASYVTPYPPCVPILIPGETIDARIIEDILRFLDLRINVNGININKEIEVIWEKSST